ncbi:MAG: hypothetical protein HY578_00845 [Nitrospinae bacterium]|nr:hypothetical protein [Nitrospinota bacterium]
MPKRIHKDFHGLLNYGLKYLEENYGRKAVEYYLVQVADNVYGGLSKRIKKQGLKALKKHLKRIFDLEEAKYKIYNDGRRLLLEVRRCPALEHMGKREYPVMKRFCECDGIITKEICKNAGIELKIKYNQKKGSCIQEFWKDER